MKSALYFLAGLVSGLAIGVLIGKRKRKKAEKDAEDVLIRGNLSEFDENEDGKEVIDVLREQHYVTEAEEADYYYAENYDDTQLQSDLDEVDDYLSGLEHPEDDVPDDDGSFVLISDDDFYTERHDFEKIKLYLGEAGNELLDGIGEDYTDMFMNRGMSLKKLMDAAVEHEGVVYYRNYRLSSDYAIFYEGGDDG